MASRPARLHAPPGLKSWSSGCCELQLGGHDRDRLVQLGLPDPDHPQLPGDFAPDRLDGGADEQPVLLVQVVGLPDGVRAGTCVPGRC